jgi:hypothetical protein
MHWLRVASPGVHSAAAVSTRLVRIGLPCRQAPRLGKRMVSLVVGRKQHHSADANEEKPPTQAEHTCVDCNF